MRNRGVDMNTLSDLNNQVVATQQFRGLQAC